MPYSAGRERASGAWVKRGRVACLAEKEGNGEQTSSEFASGVPARRVARNSGAGNRGSSVKKGEQFATGIGAPRGGDVGSGGKVTDSVAILFSRKP